MLSNSFSAVKQNKMSTFDEKAIENFREYLRIPSMHPDPDYEPCVDFLTKQAEELELKVEVFIPEPKKPIVLITWEGTEPALPAILLNSHTDVVAVYEEKWTYPPFSAHMDEKGDIYGRGAQDMKCVGIMYLEAIRRLKSKGIKLKRTLHLSFVPDEEIGGMLGMGKFVNTPEFKKLNIGFSLDESVCTPADEYYLFYGEKAIWQIHIHCPGTPAHGCSLLEETSGDKLRYIINKFLGLRDEMVTKKGDGLFVASDVTSINLTKIYGGIQENIVPDLLSVVFDIRFGVSEDLDEFETKINKWCEEAGPGVQIEYKQKYPKIPITKLDDSNIFWVAFKATMDKMKLKLNPIICPATTDSKFLREVGIPAFGFTPVINTPMLLHGHNERLNKKEFLSGINIYYELLQSIGNC